MAGAEWLEHDGRGVPVSTTTFVDVKLRSEGDNWGRARDFYGWRWSPNHQLARYDIVAYRLAAQPDAPIPGYEAKRSEPKPLETQPTEDNGR